MLRTNLCARWVIYGLVMGTAQLIPGISAGSMALLLCIYPQLMDIANHRKRLFKAPFDDLKRLTCLILGFGASLIIMSHPISWLLAERTSLSYAAFIGFIIGSLPSCRQSLDPDTLTHRHYIIMMTTCIVTALGFLYLPSEGSNHCNTHIFLSFSSFLAGCAMILPGISGSWLLLVLGCYSTWLHSIKTIDPIPLAIMGSSALIGATCVVFLLATIFDKHAKSVISGLFGLMIASLVTLYPYLSLSNESDASLIGCIIGSALISYGLTHMSNRNRH